MNADRAAEVVTPTTGARLAARGCVVSPGRFSMFVAVGACVGGNGEADLCATGLVAARNIERAFR